MKSCPICDNKNPDAERILNGIQLVKCQKCTFVFADMADEQIQQINFNYGIASDDYYAEIQGFLDEAWFDFIALRMTRRLGTGKILDVGCGNGLLLSSFARYGWLVEGLDISPWADKYARMRNFQLHNRVIEENTLPENSFDLVTSTSVLEHISEPCRHVSAILRVLKPGKTAFFAGIPNYGSASIRLGVSPFFDNTPPGHVNFFDRTSLRTVFSHSAVGSAVGKIAIHSYGIPEMHLMASIIRNMTGKLRNNQSPSEKKHHDRSASSRSANLSARLAVALWYAAGLPFGLGDKLEVTVEKID